MLFTCVFKYEAYSRSRDSIPIHGFKEVSLLFWYIFFNQTDLYLKLIVESAGELGSRSFPKQILKEIKAVLDFEKNVANNKGFSRTFHCKSNESK